MFIRVLIPILCMMSIACNINNNEQEITWTTTQELINARFIDDSTVVTSQYEWEDGNGANLWSMKEHVRNSRKKILKYNIISGEVSLLYDCGVDESYIPSGADDCVSSFDSVLLFNDHKTAVTIDLRTDIVSRHDGFSVTSKADQYSHLLSRKLAYLNRNIDGSKVVYDIVNGTVDKQLDLSNKKGLFDFPLMIDSVSNTYFSLSNIIEKKHWKTGLVDTLGTLSERGVSTNTINILSPSLMMYRHINNGMVVQKIADFVEMNGGYILVPENVLDIDLVKLRFLVHENHTGKTLVLGINAERIYEIEIPK